MIVNLTNIGICVVLNIFQYNNFICHYNFNKGQIKLNSIYSI